MRSVRYARDTGRKAFAGFFAPRLVEIDFELQVLGSRSVEDVRQLLLAALAVDPEAWGGAEGGIERILGELRDAESIADLWRIMLSLLGPGWPSDKS
jgi:hypothetical protein